MTKKKRFKKIIIWKKAPDYENIYDYWKDISVLAIPLIGQVVWIIYTVSLLIEGKNEIYEKIKK